MVTLNEAVCIAAKNLAYVENISYTTARNLIVKAISNFGFTTVGLDKIHCKLTEENKK
jgi:hypothetical protein